MGAAGRRHGSRTARYLGAVAAIALCAQAAPPCLPAQAQEVGDLADVPEGAKLLLEADTLVYDRDSDTISAVGGVRIDYGGNRLVAERVTYYRSTGKLVATGNVEIVDRQGTRITATEIDVTDDFRDGFVNTLQVETIDETFFGAESAVREGGTLTTFNNGVYTACRPCEEKPDKPPIWRIKAQKIIWNGDEKTIRFHQARFELFGLPIAYLPYFQIPDHTVKRKTGFLIPNARYSKELGFGLTTPFYIALAPTYDLTLRPTWLSRQGFLGELEWRQQFDNGAYNLKIAGINQRQPGAFIGQPVDMAETARGMIGTTGHFRINPRWSFGWDVLVQSDKNFSRTYDIKGFSDLVHRSEIYLTGLHDRNLFDLRFMRFQVQEVVLDTAPGAVNAKQPWVLPSLDYQKTLDEPVAGGELSFAVNTREIYRETDHFSAGVPAVRGLGGTNGRVTAEAGWKKTLITDGGLVITPSLHVRADGIHSDPSAVGIGNIGTVAGVLGVPANIRSSYFRGMATAGLEVRYPVLFTTGSSSHVIEPMAQLFVRPDERYAGTLGIPNEDAQSFVFDASTLFERDKYSGYDRIEGGTRANVGIRYSGSYDNGWSTHALFGQSYHLAGVNSFATADLVHAGASSGLETSVSDYVAMAGAVSPGGFSASVSGRFDERTFALRRGEVKMAYAGRPVTLSGGYTYIQAQPLYGFPINRQEVKGAATVWFDSNWRMFGSGTYDLVTKQFVNGRLGLGYDDECFSYSLFVTETRSVLGTKPPERTIGFNVKLRTLGDFGADTGEFNNDN
ncbi:MAG: LPS-assembly protein LptD [Rhizobiaceae bacterium]